MAEKNNKGKNKSKGSGLALALWVLAFLVLLIFFLVNQGRIFSNLKSTDFFKELFGKTPSFVENAEVKEVEEEKNDVGPLENIEINLTKQKESSDKDDYEEKTVVAKNSEATRMQNETSQAVAKEAAAETKKEEVKKEVEEVLPRTMNIKLYFMTINSDGSVSRKEVTRVMKKSDSPLVDAVNALIAGPTLEEENAGCRSLLSTGSRLIGASVKNGVATLNFSSEFEFNQYGIEGTRGQLQQLVYTATAFPTVESVQFLVDGEKKEYLGLEGVWIGTPLTRKSF